MNLLAPISSIMTTDLMTVSPEDTLQTIQEIFDTTQINHLPVVSKRKLVGLISSKDFQRQLGKRNDSRQWHYEKDHIRAKDFMTSKLAKLNEYDRLDLAIDLFKRNRFHSLPVVDSQDNLVGIVTTHDVIVLLSEATTLTREYA